MANLIIPNGIAQPMPVNTVPTMQTIPGISADEMALYDRQIRLWGVQAQARLRLADVLLIGMRGLGNEIAKNLILAGINSITMVDDALVTEQDLGAQFFLSDEHVGQVRSQACLAAAKALNPRVNVFSATLAPLLAEPSFFGAYTLVIATDKPLPLLKQINVACRVQSKPFYAASTFGLYGCIFADLIQHTYTITREKSNIPTTIGPETQTRSILASTTAPRNSEGKSIETVTKTETYCPINLANTSPLPEYNLANRRRKFAVSPILSCIRALWDYQTATSCPTPARSEDDLKLFTRLAAQKHFELQLPTETLRGDILSSFCQNIGSEISPVCAFLGGQLAQDVINVLGAREQPLQNFVVFDGDDMKGLVYCLFTDMEKALREVSAAAASAGAGAGPGSGTGSGGLGGSGNASAGGNVNGLQQPQQQQQQQQQQHGRGLPVPI